MKIMNIEQRIDDLTRSYKAIHDELTAYTQKVSLGETDEHLEDLVMLRDTALVLIGGLVEFRDSESIPFDIDINEVSLTIDEFIATATKVVNEKQ